MANYFEHHASSVVQFNLLDFEGPIELLYTLIVVEGKYDIETFPLSKITEQYLEYMTQVDQLDMDVASDFVSIAATLLEIKSRDCLPKEEEEFEEEYDDMEDPEESLRARIMKYALFKEQAEKLKVYEQPNKFYRKPVFSNADALLVIRRFSFDKLIDVYGQMLLRLNEEEKELAIKKIQKDPFTVADKMAYITDNIVKRKLMMFRDLFGLHPMRSEVISTFQALLELMKKQVVKAAQDRMEGEIYLQLNEDFDPTAVDMRELTKIEEEQA